MPALSLFNPDSASSIYVPEIVERYLVWLKSRVEADDYSLDGYKDNVRDLRRFAAAFNQPIESCQQSDLTRFLELNKQWAARATKTRVCAYVVACFNWAADKDNPNKLIDFCPYKLPKAISALPYKARRPADPSEYIALMRKGSRPLRRMLFFLRRTGARGCEARELLWTEVLLDEPVPYICKVRHKNHRRTGKPRIIGLDVSTANWLRALKRIATSDHVFTNCDGNPWARAVFCRHLRRCAERIGLDDGAASRVSAYCFRHSFACDGVKGGFSNRQVGDALGTSEEMIRRVYSAHTGQDAQHLGQMGSEILKRRKRD